MEEHFASLRSDQQPTGPGVLRLDAALYRVGMETHIVQNQIDDTEDFEQNAFGTSRIEFPNGWSAVSSHYPGVLRLDAALHRVGMETHLVKNQIDDTEDLEQNALGTSRFAFSSG